MADISKEIQAFRDAKKGKEVRGSMISLAEKVNYETENNTQVANTAALNADRAASKADVAANNAIVAKDITDTATANANAASSNAEAIRQDIVERLAAGEFKGDKGEKGDRGVQGASGVMAPSSGMFSLYLDPSTGDLYAEYPDGSAPPSFEYNASTGELYYVTD